MWCPSTNHWQEGISTCILNCALLWTAHASAEEAACDNAWLYSGPCRCCWALSDCAVLSLRTTSVAANACSMLRPSERTASRCRVMHAPTTTPLPSPRHPPCLWPAIVSCVAPRVQWTSTSFSFFCAYFSVYAAHYQVIIFLLVLRVLLEFFTSVMIFQRCLNA